MTPKNLPKTTNPRQTAKLRLAQYSNIAFEVLLADGQKHLLSDSGFFSDIYDSQLSNQDIAKMSAEAKAIADAWNLSIEAASRAPESNEGLSWGSEGYDEPRPHSEISKEFFLKTLQENGIKQIESSVSEGVRFDRRRTNASFSGIERRLQERGLDETKVYHLSRLAIVYPELEELIVSLPRSIIDDLFRVIQSQRENLGEAMAGPEESCWRMNGKMSVGVVFVESSQTGGPTFTSDRTNNPA